MSSLTSSYAETFRATICIGLVLIRKLRKNGIRTSEACSHEDSTESGPADERCISDPPIGKPNEPMISIDSRIDQSADDDEGDYSDDFERREDIFWRQR